MIRALRSLLCDTHGVMTIETAIVAPVLALMAIGTFEAGTLVSRQQELQSAASEAEGIILATSSGGVLDLAGVQDVIRTSLDPDGSREHLDVDMAYRVRCNTEAALVMDDSGCDPDLPAYVFVILNITDRYEPVWTQFGISSGFDYNVRRTIQVR